MARMIVPVVVLLLAACPPARGALLRGEAEATTHDQAAKQDGRRRLRHLERQTRQLFFDDVTGLANVVVTCETNSEFECQQGIEKYSSSTNIDGKSTFTITYELVGTDYFALSISKPDLEALVASVDKIKDVEQDHYREMFEDPYKDDAAPFAPVAGKQKFTIEDFGDTENEQVHSYAHDMMEVPRAWKLAKNHDRSNHPQGEQPGAGATVCVIDTGYEPHVDVNASRVRGFDIEPEVVWDSDPRGHGTLVLGIVAAADNSQGTVGVVPGADVVVVRMMDTDGRTLSSTLAEAALLCHRKGGADIVTISLGGTGASAFERDIFASLYDEYDVLVVAAAGNSGWRDDNPVYYPAAYPKVVSVGALDNAYEPTSFSTYNPFVDVSAPGVHIASLANNRTGYLHASGTSAAAPLVAGVAALLKSSVPSASAGELHRALVKGAIDVNGAGRDDRTGFGLVNAVGSFKVLYGVEEFEELPEDDDGDICKKLAAAAADAALNQIETSSNSVPVTSTGDKKLSVDPFQTALLEIDIMVNDMAHFHRSRLMVHDVTTRGIESRVLRARLPNNRRFNPRICIDPSQCYNFFLSDDGGGGAGDVALTYEGRRIYGDRDTRGGNGFVATFGDACPECIPLSLNVQTKESKSVRYRLEDATEGGSAAVIWDVNKVGANRSFTERVCGSPNMCLKLTLENDEDGTSATRVHIEYNGRSIYQPKDGSFGVRRVYYFGNSCL